MASDVYTKNEILQNLASKGFFVDEYTLNMFFKKWKIEAIFEDEQGSEFYDKNALELVMNNLFNVQDNKENSDEEKLEEPRILKEPSNVSIEQLNNNFAPQQNIQMQQQLMNQNMVSQPNNQMYSQNLNKPNIDIYQQQLMKQNMAQNNGLDMDTNQILNNISLSNGMPLINSLQDLNIGETSNIPLPTEIVTEAPTEPVKEKKMGILEGAMLASGKEYTPELPTESTNPEDNPDFDDISLLSESLEAQEKFREYVVSELSKKNVDLTPKSNEFKLDISERTLNMIARTMAKKIAKHVTQLCSVGTKSPAELEEIEEKTKKLEQRSKDLEDQNKKLRLLLVESNKNLNSYKPTFFGLYKKVPPTQ